jgi:hypothetical protein
MTPGQRVVHVVAVVQVKPFLSAKSVPQTAQLDGIRFLVTKQWIWRLFTWRLGPQLILTRIRVSHLQVIQCDFYAVFSTLVRSDGKRLTLCTHTHIHIIYIIKHMRYYAGQSNGGRRI